ncbi:MAG TPA: PilC/PilY family type IV pilus protein [Candidatus Binatia bacterium]
MTRTPSTIVRLLPFLVLMASAVPAHAGTDLDVFAAGLSVQPNVLIQFDNSGSMNSAPDYDPATSYSGTYTPATIYDRCKTFNSSTCTCTVTQTTWKNHTNSCGFVDADSDGQDDRAPSYVKNGNRRNFESNSLYATPKLSTAKSVITGLLQDPANTSVRFGLEILNGTTIPTDYTSKSQVTSYHNDKSILAAVVGTDHTTLATAVNALTAHDGTPLANRTIAAAHYFKHDGYFSLADPIQYTCQRNFLVIMTDGRPQVEGDTAFGSCDSGFSDPLCGANADGKFSYIESWLGTPHDKDGDGVDPDYYHYHPPAGCDSSSPDQEPCEYQNGGSDYLDDVCKVLATTDLRADLDGQQSLITYTIGFSVANGLLQRAAAEGGGLYYTAGTADQLADAFQLALKSIQTQTESFVAPVVPVSQTTRTQSGDRLYIALFQPRDATLRWPGNLKKYAVSPTGDLLDADGHAATDANGNILTNARSYWDTAASGSTVTKGGVGELLANRSTPRNIYTHISGTDLTAAANSFSTGNASLTQAMLGAGSSGQRTNIINYISGVDSYDEDLDGNTTETRSWVLGDIVHSVPLVVHYSSTDALILIGGNDGMLHAFDDSTGQELWAYVPEGLLGSLKVLTPTVGTTTHPFFVDSSVKLVTIGSTKTVVFGLGRGGREYYALDVTSKTAPKFLWRDNNSTAGMSELGQTWSEPAFTKASISGSAVDAMVVGAGYDTYFDTPTNTAANGGGMGRGIFVINPSTGVLLKPLIRPAGMDWAIPSTVGVLDLTGDGIVDRAYVGDLGGQLWRLDSTLTATKLFTTGTGTAPTGRKIYYPPDVVRDRGFLSVFFGTGDRSNPLQTTVVDRIYALHDDGTANRNESNLIDVTSDVRQNGSSSETSLKTAIKNASGWFIQLNANPGEKVLASPTAFFSIFFSTFTPVSGACNAGGDARLYTLNYATGGIPDSSVQDPDGPSGPGQPPTVSTGMRVDIIGKSIPTELTVTIQKTSSAGFIASSGAVGQPPLAALPNNVTPISWRECSTLTPCP